MNEVRAIGREAILIRQNRMPHTVASRPGIRVHLAHLFKNIRAALKAIGVRWRAEALRAAEIERALNREKVRMHERLPFRGYGHW